MITNRSHQGSVWPTYCKQHVASCSYTVLVAFNIAPGKCGVVGSDWEGGKVGEPNTFNVGKDR